MLRKGTVDLLLAKPVSRPGLLLYKYVGGLTFMVLNTIVLVFGLWVALGLRSGIWEFAILLMIPVLTLECALFYALSTLLAVLTRSPVVCILGCFLLWGVLFGLGWGHWVAAMAAEGRGDESPGWFTSTLMVAHKVMPHYLDFDWLVDRTVMEHMQPEANRGQIALKYGMYSWSESLGVTSLYIVFLLGLSCWRFWAKDY
jgi:ABC-type transport system involved in multi-copper enzyme maturation permease subunit